MPRTLLLDADIIAFAASANAEQAIDWGDTGTSRTTDIEGAKTRVVKQIERLKEKLDADDAIVCLSTPPYFRLDFFPEYKAHRTAGARPLALDEVKAFLREGAGGYTVKAKPNLEADDVIGILATHPTLVPGEKVIVTSDKDLDQIPGLHHNPRHDRTYGITPEEADHFFYMQALHGDPTDGFKGCPKVGKVKAAKVLDEVVESFQKKPFGVSIERHYWFHIVQTYERAGLTADHALTQARVARILRHTDYNFQEKKPILWTPPTTT